MVSGGRGRCSADGKPTKARLTGFFKKRVEFSPNVLKFRKPERLGFRTRNISLPGKNDNLQMNQTMMNSRNLGNERRTVRPPGLRSFGPILPFDKRTCRRCNFVSSSASLGRLLRSARRPVWPVCKRRLVGRGTGDDHQYFTGKHYRSKHCLFQRKSSEYVQRLDQKRNDGKSGSGDTAAGSRF